MADQSASRRQGFEPKAERLEGKIPIQTTAKEYGGTYYLMGLAIAAQRNTFTGRFPVTLHSKPRRRRITTG